MPASAIERRFPSLRMARVRLGDGPTPALRLDRLEAAAGAGADLWCKQDGLFGQPYGGNKARKLEWLLGDCLARGRRGVLTIGGTGTNHGLATTIYARAHGLESVLLLVDQPETEQVRAQLGRLREAGAIIHRTGGALRTALATPYYLLRHRLPYFVMVGGSTPLGTIGMVDAALELCEQVAAGELPEPSHVVCAVGSGGTAAGLLLGLRLGGLRSRVVGAVVSDQLSPGARTIAALAMRTQALLRRHGAAEARAQVVAEDLVIERGFLGAGYGHPLPAAERAAALAAHAGLHLEGVYTGKAMAALLELRRQRAFGDGPVLYWHTHNARPLAAALEHAA